MTLFIYYFVMFMMVLWCYNTPQPSAMIAYRRFGSFKFLSINLIPICIYSLFWGLRYQVGVDYPTYMEAYNYGITEYFEVGYLFIQGTLRALDLPYPFIFIVTSFIIICSVTLLAKGRNGKFLALLMLFFWSSETIYFAQNGVRQMLALSMIFVAIQHLTDKKYYRAVVFCLLAFSFHTSSVIYSFLVSFVYIVTCVKEISVNKYVVLGAYLFMELSGKLVSLPDLPFVSDIIVNLGYENKLDMIDNYDWDVKVSSGLGVILRMFTNSVIILSQNRMLVDADRLKKVFYWLFVIGAMLLPILSSNLVMNRILTYMVSANFVMYTFFCIDLWNGKIVSKRVSHILVIIFIIYNLGLLTKNSNTNGCKVYQTIFSPSNRTSTILFK